MTKAQIFLSLGAILLILFLFQLPRVVVSNEDLVFSDTHDFSVSATDASVIQSLKEKLKSGNSENSFNFADSLAGYFLKYGFLDSAENLVNRYMTEDRSLNSLKKTASLQYALFERSVASSEAKSRAMSARETLSAIMAIEPENLQAKNMLAMTLVNTENPMAAIQLLREVLEADPTNREAILNLGLLAIQSGQFEKAVERFEALVASDTSDYEAYLYLGVAQLESGKNSEANESFRKIANAANADPALKATALEYLK